MRPFVTLLLAALFTAATAHAQVGPMTDVITIGIPITVQTGSVTYVDSGDAITADGGVSSPIPGFLMVDIDTVPGRARYNIIDLTGGMAVVACFALPCNGIPEQRDGVDTDEGWVFIDGVLLPRFDSGMLVQTGIGAIGGGVSMGASGAGSSGDGGSLGWVDAGPQLSYGLNIGDLTALATGSYVWAYEGGSQSLSGRGARFKAFAVYPIGGYHIVGSFAIDRRTDDGGNDDPADDFEGSFVTFGVGLGF